MKKLASVSVLLLTGCVGVAQNRFELRELGVLEKQDVYRIKKDFSSRTGSELPIPDTVEKIQGYFHTVTGKDLPPVDASSCYLDFPCYYRKWYEAFAAGMEPIVLARNKESEERQKKRDAVAAQAQREYEACLKTPSCSYKYELQDARDQLYKSYQALVHSSPYRSAENDAAFRKLCGIAANAERQGSKRQEVVNWASDLPGISFEYRHVMVSGMDACWKMSHLNADWREPIRGTY